MHENTVVLNGEVVFEGREAFFSSRGGSVFCIIGISLGHWWLKINSPAADRGQSLVNSMTYDIHIVCIYIYIWIKSMGSPMIFLPYLPWIWCQSCNPMRDVALDTKDPKNSDYTMESGGKRNLDKANIKHDPKGKLIGTVDNGNHRLLGQARYARVCWGFSRSTIIHFPRLSPCTIKIEPMVRFQGRVTIHPYDSSYIPSTFCQMVLNLILLNRFESMFARLSLGAAYIYRCQTRCMHHYDLYAW